MSIPAINWCIDQADLPPGEWVLLFHLCHAHNQEYGCFPSQEFLAEKTNMSLRTINRHMASLEDRGRLTKTRRFNANGSPISSFYTFPFMPEFRPSANLTTGQSVYDHTPSRAQNRHEMACKQEEQEREQEVSTPKSPSTDLDLFQSKNPTSKKDAEIEVLGEVTEILCQVVPLSVAEDFIGHRKDLKKPMTIRSANAMVKQLAGHHDPTAVFTASIANGWQGVFPEKINPNGANYGNRQQQRDKALHDEILAAARAR